MEQGAAPTGAGLTWSCALGRLRGTARRALGPGCEELADGRGYPRREARPGAEKTPRWSAERRASFIRARSTPGLVRAPADRSRREHKAGAPLGAPPPLIF